jgi:hypothetical protein
MLAEEYKLIDISLISCGSGSDDADEYQPQSKLNIIK